VAMIVGWVLCCNVPNYSGGRLPIFAALACVVLFVLVFVTQFSLSRSGNAPRADVSPTQMQDPFGASAGQPAKPVPTELRISFWISTLLSGTSQAFFALFLGAVGKTKGRRDIWGWVVAFVSLQCIAAIWATIMCFGTVYPPSPEAAKVWIAPTLAGNLLSDLCLLYIVHQAREALRY
jgi:hypothetical protein